MILFVVMLLIITNTSAFANITGKGQIDGKVIDNASKTPLEYVTISLHNTSDSSLVTGTISDIKGLFTLEKINDGNYFLNLSFL